MSGELFVNLPQSKYNKTDFYKIRGYNQKWDGHNLTFTWDECTITTTDDSYILSGKGKVKSNDILCFDEKDKNEFEGLLTVFLLRKEFSVKGESISQSPIEQLFCKLIDNGTLPKQFSGTTLINDNMHNVIDALLTDEYKGEQLDDVRKDMFLETYLQDIKPLETVTVAAYVDTKASTGKQYKSPSERLKERLDAIKGQCPSLVDVDNMESLFVTCNALETSDPGYIGFTDFIKHII